MAEQTEARVCAVVLAAGLSARMGENKLLLPYKGGLMCEQVLQNLRANSACFGQLLLVGRGAELRALAPKYGFTLVENDKPELGMGRSVALGVAAAGQWSGFLLALADMPDLKQGTVHTLCAGFLKQPERIAVPVFGGRRGNPVLFPARLRGELEALTGDKGGRGLILREEEKLCRVQVYDPAVLRDIDTREEYLAAQGR